MMKKDNALTTKILTYGRMIKFSHTIFALPFALAAVVLAYRQYSVTVSDFLWILLAMAGARSAAMGFNRIADAELDKKNPRTANREIPSGVLSIGSAYGFVGLSSLVFIVAAGMLAPICFYCSFPVLGLLFLYSYTKRFTWLAHLYLGFVISLAPLGAWLALAKTFYWPILLLSLALMTYIAGFDILYACQDIDFDKDQGLYSIPARFGVHTSMTIASALHVVSFVCFIWIYFAFNMGMVYLICVGVIGALLIFEHRIVKPDDLSRIDMAFFHVNSIISTILFLGILADELVRGLG